MRKLFVVSTLLIIMSTSMVFAQSKSIFTINAGYQNPKDAKGGMLVGVTMGTAIDEAVDIGVGVDVFHKAYSEETQVAKNEQEGLTTNTASTLVDYARTIVPVNLVLNVKIPFSRYMGYFIRGTLSYQFLISQEKNYELNLSKTRKFGGLGWRGAAGVYYRVGRRSTLLADVFYNNCEVSRSISKSDKGLPVTERVDLSGLGFRLGVALDMR
ncbi:MAG: hypothetical protein GXO75_11205 [Calditrichaeota bacterium]|nr:hypothetical protein [Calditrichota bacterium]